MKNLLNKTATTCFFAILVIAFSNLPLEAEDGFLVIRGGFSPISGIVGAEMFLRPTGSLSAGYIQQSGNFVGRPKIPIGVTFYFSSASSSSLYFSASMILNGSWIISDDGMYDIFANDSAFVLGWRFKKDKLDFKIGAGLYNLAYTSNYDSTPKKTITIDVSVGYILF